MAWARISPQEAATLYLSTCPHLLSPLTSLLPLPPEVNEEAERRHGQFRELLTGKRKSAEAVKADPAPRPLNLRKPGTAAWGAAGLEGSPRRTPRANPASPALHGLPPFSPQLTLSSWRNQPRSPRAAQAPCIRRSPQPFNKRHADWTQWCRRAGRAGQSGLSVLALALSGAGLSGRPCWFAPPGPDSGMLGGIFVPRNCSP